jgi:hypothetical protein
LRENIVIVGVASATATKKKSNRNRNEILFFLSFFLFFIRVVAHTYNWHAKIVTMNRRVYENRGEKLAYY